MKPCVQNLVSQEETRREAGGNEPGGLKITPCPREGWPGCKSTTFHCVFLSSNIEKHIQFRPEATKSELLTFFIFLFSSVYAIQAMAACHCSSSIGFQRRIYEIYILAVLVSSIADHLLLIFADRNKVFINIMHLFQFVLNLSDFFQTSRFFSTSELVLSNKCTEEFLICYSGCMQFVINSGKSHYKTSNTH